jgi:hypothetical protein
MTSVAALQCVERGQVALDDDLSKVVPELNDLDVLTGFDESGEPILKKVVNKITLRYSTPTILLFFSCLISSDDWILRVYFLTLLQTPFNSHSRIWISGHELKSYSVG